MAHFGLIRGRNGANSSRPEAWNSISLPEPSGLQEKVWISLSGAIRTADRRNGRPLMNLSAYWKPTLLLFAFAVAGPHRRLRNHVQHAGGGHDGAPAQWPVHELGRESEGRGVRISPAGARHGIVYLDQGIGSVVGGPVSD